MKNLIITGMDNVERNLTRSANSLGYVRVVRLAALDNITVGNAERPVRFRGRPRFEWTVQEATDVLEEPATTADIPRAAIAWIRLAIQEEQQSGDARYRVRAYRPGAVSTAGSHSPEWSINIRALVEDDEFEDTIAPPSTADEALRVEALLAVRAAVRETNGIVAMTSQHYAGIIDFYKEENGRLHASIEAKDKLIATLTAKVVDRDRQELATQIGQLETAQTELGVKASRANMLDRLEGIVSKVVGVQNLSDDALEFLPLLAQDDVIRTFRQPRVRSVLMNPEARKELLDTLSETLEALAPEEAA